MKTLDALVHEIEDPRARKILKFHTDHRARIARAAGSSHNHQAWPGGYADHIAETLRIARDMYALWDGRRPLPFTRGSAEIVLYFHDVEKIWKYTDSLPADFDKGRFLRETLDRTYGIRFTPEEELALRYIHGENEDYRGDRRVMNELGAFCHCCDVLSARLWHDQGRGLG